MGNRCQSAIDLSLAVAARFRLEGTEEKSILPMVTTEENKFWDYIKYETSPYPNRVPLMETYAPLCLCHIWDLSTLMNE
jgi:hypothetical protein